jgi:hypothetical protein
MNFATATYAMFLLTTVLVHSPLQQRKRLCAGRYSFGPWSGGGFCPGRKPLAEIGAGQFTERLSREQHTPAHNAEHPLVSSKIAQTARAAIVCRQLVVIMPRAHDTTFAAHKVAGEGPEFKKVS